MKIAHIINPVIVPESSDLRVAQPVTFASMFAAKREAIDDVDIDLQSICYEEDSAIIPPRFQSLPFLARSVLDLKPFKKQRKLPLIQDILDAAVEGSDADYFIYTNVDISPMPFFYRVVSDLLKSNDALVINRRTIQKCETGNHPLPFYYHQVGESHPGFDCFVFSRTQYQQYKLYDACVGANWIGRVLICNLLAYADRPNIITDSHLTFHLGDDRSWKTLENLDFDEHNELQVGRLMQAIHAEGRLNRHELLQRSYEEFHLKTLDPDTTRPKVEHAAAPAANENSSWSAMPQEHLPSRCWEDPTASPLRQDPIFIVGHPRSGTSLLQSLVATQTTSRVFPETHFFSIVRTFIKVTDDRIEPGSLNAALDFAKQKLVLSTPLENYLLERVTKNQLSPKIFFEAIVFDQLSQHLNINQIRNMVWLEKTPDHAEHLYDMKRFYPEARFIFIVRHPEKAILSRRKHFTFNDEATWPIKRHAERWMKTIQSAEDFKSENPERIFYVKFEDLVTDKETMVAAICQFLNVPFVPSQLNQQSEFSRQQSLPWETWKADTRAEVSAQIAAGAPESLTTDERAVLHEMLGSYLAAYDYPALATENSFT